MKLRFISKVFFIKEYLIVTCDFIGRRLVFPASCIFMKTRFGQPNCPRYVWSVTEGRTVVADDAVIMILRKKRDPPNQFAINRCTCTLCKINMFYFNRPLFTPDLIDNEFERLICARYKNWYIFHNRVQPISNVNFTMSAKALRLL